MFARLGIPDEIISDNGRQFGSKDCDQFSSQLGIKDSKTALNHPQTNGAVERFNRVLKEGTRAFKAQGRTFDDALRATISNYLSTPQSKTGFTPSDLMIGRRFKMPLDLLASHHPRRHVHFQNSLADRVSKKQHNYKAYGDKRRRAKQSHLDPGDIVHVQIQNRHSQLDPVLSLPQNVVSKPSEHTVRLEEGNTWNAEKLI